MLKFHIPDFTKNYKLTSCFLSFFKVFRTAFIDDCEIAYVYDSFPLVWNGGRLVRGTVDFQEAEKIIREINEKGVKLSFTFTNSLLTEEHLKDPACNRIMKMASNTGVKNSVILASPLLDRYIREEYPDFERILSTTMQLGSAEAVNDAIDRDYDLVVLDYNMNHDWEELEKIRKKEKCEFLVNACCRDDCPDRAAHYRNVSLQQIRNQDPEAKIRYWRCQWGKGTYFSFRHYRNFMGIDEIRSEYEPMGFSHFKLEGRGGDRIHLLEQYIQYLVKPEYRDEVRFKLLHMVL